MSDKRSTIQLKRLFFTVLIVGGFYIFAHLNFWQNQAFALVGNYNRLPAENSITAVNWNDLASDFLMKDGVGVPASFNNNMGGNLDMNNNRILNLTTDASSPLSAVSVSFVSSVLIASQDSDVYINWGRQSCGGTDTLLYSGYGFGSTYSFVGGSDNPICMAQPASFLPGHTAATADKMYPLMTSSPSLLPTSADDPLSTYDTMKAVKCAACFRSHSSCYLRVGSHNCDTAGFTNKAYDGYMAGGISDAHSIRMERNCLNRQFDNTHNITSYGALWYGSRLQDNFGQSGYTTLRYLPCAVCCN